MSDTRISVSEKKFNAAWIPTRNAKIIRESVENGTAPFLPDSSGKIKTEGIYNGNTGRCLNARDLIPVQLAKKDGFSNVVVTKTGVDAAGTRIRQGEAGFMYNFQRADKSVGTTRYYFPEQTEDPGKVIDAAMKKIEGVRNETFAPNRVVEITSADPAEYLGSYVAACRTGVRLVCSPEIAEQFKENIMPVLDNQLAKPSERVRDGNGIGSPLAQFLYKVDARAKDVVEKIAREEKTAAKAVTQEKTRQKHIGRDL